MKSSRRKFLALVGTSSTVALAGCLPDSTEKVDELPRPTLGNENANVVLRVFEDLGCPNCARYSTSVEPALIDEYVETGDIRYEFYDYVIPARQQSNFLNNSARAVQDRQGNQAFWDYIKSIFERQNEVLSGNNLDVLREEAEAVGVESPDDMLNDADSGVYNPVLDSDKSFASEEYNVSATPTLVLNDVVLSGAEFDVLSQAIDSQLN